MVAAIYTRKSVYSDHSDSIGNQTQMCKDYLSIHFAGQISDSIIYIDEGLTGANVNRPGLQRLLSDIKQGRIQILIVYQLDRISRDVRDFSNIYSLASQNDVKFISVKENIDTSTPIGKAMMYVTVVFAQMERETIASRVTDNMLYLSSEGWWAGGSAPVGYRRERVKADDGKNHVTIVPDPDGADHVRYVFKTFLDGNHTISSLQTYFKQQGIRTINGKFFSSSQIYSILSCPYYVPAAPEIYDHYKNMGCQITDDREKWDGSHGVMIYGRTTEKSGKHRLASPDHWRLCAGRHEPIISVSTFLAAQEKFGRNKISKRSKYPAPLLKGIVRCTCGRSMSISRKKKKSGGVSSWYYCPKRVTEGIDACPVGHIKCDILDEKVLSIFREISVDEKVIEKYLDRPNNEKSGNVDQLKRQLKIEESKLRNLSESLSMTTGTAAKYIIQEIEKHDRLASEIREKLFSASNQDRIRSIQTEDTKRRLENIKKIIDNIDSFSPDEMNAIARETIRKCTFDGENLQVFF